MRLDQPEEMATIVGPLMDGFGGRWCIAGGWALDLFLGRVTRTHDDVELTVFRQDQSLLHAQFEGWTFNVSLNRVRTPWDQGEVLELPVHEIHAYSRDEPRRSIEFLLNERDGENWVFRRDPAIVLPLDRAIVKTGFGVDVLSPEIVLLFKSKSPRAKDEADFHAARPALSDERRSWLRSALRATDPDHPWIPLIEQPPTST